MENKKQMIEKIKKVMAKFHINEDELGEELTESKLESMECEVVGKTQKWKLQLAVVLANNFRCKIYLKNNNVTFYGYEEDVNVCSEVFYSLYKIGVRLSDKLKRETRKEKGTAKGIRNTFCVGFVAGIKSKLEKQCTALMIVIPKEVNDGYAKMSANWGKGKSSNLRIGNDKSIYEKGFQSGKDAVRKRSIEGGK